MSIKNQAQKLLESTKNDSVLEMRCDILCKNKKQKYLHGEITVIFEFKDGSKIKFCHDTITNEKNFFELLV